MTFFCDTLGFFKGFWKIFERLGRYQLARRLSDDIYIRRLGYLQCALCLNSICHGTGHTGLGLTYVGSGNFTDPKPVLRGFKLAAQDLFIVFVELENCSP